MGQVIRAGLAGLVAFGTLVAAPTPVSATFSCQYTASTHKVEIGLSGFVSASLTRERGGKIVFAGSYCQGATVNNTDKINVLAGDGNQGLTILLRNGGFKPGFTNEAGASDEIEISVSLGAGTDGVLVYGDEADDKIAIGKSSGFGVQGRINLNAGETDGVDTDVTLVVGIENVTVWGDAGADSLMANGGAGSGNAGDFPVTLRGFGGPDVLTGGDAGDTIVGDSGGDTIKGGAGTDDISGGAGGDTLSGGDGADNIDAADGVNGNDTANGGNGSDMCTADPGDSLTSC